MKNLWNNDTFLKIFSIVVAILCWVFIVFVTNPEIEVEISGIPVTLSDHHSIKSNGYIVSTEMTQTVDVKLKGTRSALANINKDNIIAYVDLSGCNKKDSFNLPVNVKLPYENVKVISKSIYNTTVSVDNYITRSFRLDYAHIGALKNSNYSVYSTDIGEKTVKVSGAEELVKTIEKATVHIDVNRKSTDFSGNAPIVFTNSNKTEIMSEIMEPEFFDVPFKCTVYEKKAVDVVPVFEQEDEGIKYTIKDYHTVTVYGPAAEVDKMESISTKAISYNANNLPREFEVSLSIPNSIEVVENISKVKVLVENK